MKNIFCVLLSLPIIATAQFDVFNKNQQSIPGINWIEGLEWEQILLKAKQENKYIFLDCYTTWCGPCKLMDKLVYVNDTVGRYFNDRFLSVKVQMDRTDSDKDVIKRWYNDAAAIAIRYQVEAFPCLIFISPEGNIVHKEIGYKSVNDFIAIAQSATKPGKVFDDPYTKYQNLVTGYKNGIKQYNMMPFMIKNAIKYHDSTIVYQLVKDHIDFVCSLNESERYSRENIELWNMFGLHHTNRLFQFFYKDDDKIDSVMGQKGYAIEIVDETIHRDFVIPFFVEQNTNPSIQMQGLFVSGPGLKADYSEADWKKLYKSLRKEFNPAIAKRNVLKARIEWYKRHRNQHAQTKYMLIRLKDYPLDLSNQNTAMAINEFAWPTFLFVTDRKLIKETMKWMEKVVHQFPNDDVLLDTYANLLYKAGFKDKAIRWEEKALFVSKGQPIQDVYVNVIEDMKKGKPTYLKDGAIWNEN